MNQAPPDSPAFMLPAEDYPLRTSPAEPIARRDIVWLAVLILLTLLPRLIVAVNLGPVCDDGYFYLAVADAYERGDLRTALWYLNINIYPVLLAGFKQLGFDVLTAAQAWGVLVATLTVLPLFGWLRRLLDRRVALAACGLYAVHPEFIEITPEPIRDATFWLLAATSLYLLWRAAAERRLWLFACAGTAIALAAHTRTEGWLLMLPAIAWPLVRWRQAAGDRVRLAFGVLTTMAMTPLFVVAFNMTVLAHHDRWEWGKLEHFRLPSLWVAGADSREMPPQTHPATPLAAPTPSFTTEPVDLSMAAPSLAKSLKHDQPRPKADRSSFLLAAARALEPVPLILMLVGAIVWRRLLLRREHLVLSAICLAAVTGVWVRLSTLGEINGRYFLICFFPASGAAGLGLLWVMSRLELAWTRIRPHRRAAAAVASIVIVVGGAHVAEAVAGLHPSRDREERIGRLLGARLAPRELVVLPHACRVGYYASGRLPVVVLDDTPIETLLDEHSADVVILEHRYTPAARCADLTARLIRLGWRPYDLSGMPDADTFVVLTRSADSVADSTLRSKGTDVR